MNRPDIEECRIIRAQGYRETAAYMRERLEKGISAPLKCPHLGTVASAEWSRGSRQACEDAVTFARLRVGVVSTGAFQ